jgi:hypothetical protein
MVKIYFFIEQKGTKEKEENIYMYSLNRETTKMKLPCGSSYDLPV